MLWTKREGGWFDDSGQALATDAAGNIYLSGYFRSNTVNFGFITLTNSGASTFSGDVFIAKYTPSGNLLWVKGVGGSNNDAAKSIAIDASGNTYIAGFFWSATMAFGSTILTNADNSESTYDMFVAKLDNTGTTVAGINSVQPLENVISFFPNPSSGILYLEIKSDVFLPSEIEICDVHGKIIFDSEILDQRTELNLSGNAAGVYFYHVIDPSGIIGTGKIILR